MNDNRVRMSAIRGMRRLNARNCERVIAKLEQYARDLGSLVRQVVTLTGGKYR